MTIKSSLIKRDSLGRRTDRVRKRELNEMVRLHTQGLVYAEIATKLKRKPETVKRHIEAALHSGKGLPVDPTINLQRHYAHWGSLSKLAEELKQSLELPKDLEIVDTYFGMMIQQSWYCHEGKIYFSTQNSPLWECLLQHLDNEFEHPRFSYALKKFQQTAAQLLNGKPEGHPVMARSYQLAQSLSHELSVVIERGTFIGTCDICKEWDRLLP
ncbi:hypothetical protein ES703_81923 [subsurface metagenome]